MACDSSRVSIASGLARADEAAALLAGVVPGVAEQLGLHADVDRARRKVRSQSGGDGRNGPILIDPVGWYRTPDEVPHLATLAEALRTHTIVTMRYSRWEQPTQVTRTIAPFGLVLKAGAWYVMARKGRQIRTYRVNQIPQRPVDLRAVTNPTHLSISPQPGRRSLPTFDSDSTVLMLACASVVRHATGFAPRVTQPSTTR